MRNYFIVILLLLFLLIFGCAAPITMISTERDSLEHYKYLELTEMQNDVIGEINESVINKILDKSIKGIIKLNRFDKIVVPEKIEINDENILSNIITKSESQNNLPNSAVLKIVLLKYNKGNSFVRFLFGALAGSGEVTCELIVLDKGTNNEVLKAQTTAQISGAFSSESNVIGPISKAIVKFVKEEFTFTGNYLAIILTDDNKKIFGEVKNVKKDKIYLADKKTLYIINKNKILSIQDDNVEVSWEELSQKKYKRINYNRYSDSITIK